MAVAAALDGEADGPDADSEEEADSGGSDGTERSGATPPSRGTKRLPPLPENHFEFWCDLMARRIKKPSAESMLPFLDKRDALGVDKSRAGVSLGPESIYSKILEAKHAHPTKMVLVRVGEFYETMGFDAALLVEFAGLNPMGARPFKAGMPVDNLRRTLDALLREGLSVAVVEEAPAERIYGQKTSTKTRFLAGVVTPSSPEYVYGLARLEDDAGGYTAAAPPTLGVAYDARGYTLIEVHADSLTYSVTEALPEQALVARLSAAPSAPLYEHTSLNLLPGYSRSGTAGTGRSRHDGAALAAAMCDRPGGRQRYEGDRTNALLEVVAADLTARSTDAGSLPRFKKADATLYVNSPRPLFLSAAQALGIVHTSGVPDLLASLLPSHTPRLVSDALRALLLSPPPEEVAHALRAAHQELSGCAAALPAPPLVPAGRIVRLISERECSASFFADIWALCAGMQALFDGEESRQIGQALIPVTQLAVGSRIDAGHLAEECKVATDVLKRNLAPSLVASGTRSNGSSGAFAVPRDQLLSSAVRDADGKDVDTPPTWEELWPQGDAPLQPPEVTPIEMLRANERFRGRVRRACMSSVQHAYDAVEAAAAELDAALRDDLQPFVDAARGQSRVKGAKKAVQATSIVYDVNNNAVWLKAPERPKAAAAGVPSALIDKLFSPEDRLGRRGKTEGRYSTQRVEKANDAYRRAAEDADAAVLDALSCIAQELEPRLSSLVAAAQLALYLRLATDHASEARLRRWCLPELLPEGQPWRMTALTPAWMDRKASTTVSNDFACDGMLLLTGPNMAGKSTVARAAGAAALLANCGLHVPAAAASVPRFRAYFVRMTSSDAPAEGLSHWGLDMKETAALTEPGALGPGACVMLDELCQGTEVAHATALAGALLETLDKSRARGIFATHLHGVLRMPLALENTTRMAMETTIDAASGTLRPTMRIVPGECTKSLAFEVAVDCGVAGKMLARAEQLLPLAGATDAGAATNCQPASSPAAQKMAPSPAAVPPPRLPPLKSSRPLAPTLDDARRVLEKEWMALLGDQPMRVYSAAISDNFKPGPMTMNRGAVYVLHVVPRNGAAAQFYCGQTVNIQQRFDAHAHSERFRDSTLHALYVLLPEKESGKRRELEKRTIDACIAAGLRILHDSDKNSRSFEE